MPHGPAKAVSVAVPCQFHSLLGLGGAESFMLSGCPESMRDMSGSGPFGPIFSGVWQSLQEAMVTKYLPRSIWAALSAAEGLDVACSEFAFLGEVWQARVATPKKNAAASILILYFSLPVKWNMFLL